MAERSGRWRLVVPVLGLLTVVVVAAGWWLRDSSAPAEMTPVEVSAQGPRFDDLDELVAASDLVVIGTVTTVDQGRTITDPSDPSAGLRTQLAAVDVDVDATLSRDQSGPLVVEQEAALLDGTPMIVNGVTPLVEGDEGVMFLTVGDSDEFPYTSFVNEQGWVPIVDGAIGPVDPVDPVWASMAGASTATLVGLLASAD